MDNIKKFDLKIDATDVNGICRPLNEAIRLKNHKLAEILLKNATLLGIDLNAKNPKGFTYEDMAGRDRKMREIVQNAMFATIAKRQKM